jgi:phosphatidylserine decarboxylase
MHINWNNILRQIRFAIARPLHPQGVIWVGVPLLLTVVALTAGWHSANFWLALTVIFYICFRDPPRVPPVAANLGVAPADGILTAVDRAPWPFESGQMGEAQRIVISPRFYDVHVLRAPAAGMLTFAQQFPGQWGSDVFEKSAAGNERAVFVLKLMDGRVLALEIIGGAAPERIKLSAHTGDVITLAQPLGYAAFGGEVRLYLPDGITILARPGQHMTAGETALAAL